jgi:hypothetical protein
MRRGSDAREKRKVIADGNTRRYICDATSVVTKAVFLRRRNFMADEDPNQQNQAPLEQAEFDINDANTEVAHRAICDAVNGLNGVREVQFVGGGVVVTFNPIGITKEEICTVIRRSGYRATEITSSPGKVGQSK